MEATEYNPSIRRFSTKKCSEKTLFSFWSVLNDEPVKNEKKIYKIWEELTNRGYILRNQKKHGGEWIRPDGLWQRG